MYLLIVSFLEELCPNCYLRSWITRHGNQATKWSDIHENSYMWFFRSHQRKPYLIYWLVTHLLLCQPPPPGSSCILPLLSHSCQAWLWLSCLFVASTHFLVEITDVFTALRVLPHAPRMPLYSLVKYCLPHNFQLLAGGKWIRLLFSISLNCCS